MSEQQPLLGDGSTAQGTVPNAIKPNKRRGLAEREKGIVKSSLDIVFSYSRSQQMFFGSHLPSAPSFVDHDVHDGLLSRAGSANDGAAERRRRWIRFRQKQARAAAGEDTTEGEAEGDDSESNTLDEEELGSGDEEDEDSEGEAEWRKSIDVDPDDAQHGSGAGLLGGNDHSPSPSRGNSPRRASRQSSSGPRLGGLTNNVSGAGTRRVSAGESPNGTRRDDDGYLPPSQSLVSAGPGQAELQGHNSRPGRGYGATNTRWNSTRTITSSNAFGESVQQEEAGGSFTPGDTSEALSEGDDTVDSITPTASHISAFAGDDSHLQSILEEPGSSSKAAGRKPSSVSLRLPEFSMTPASQRSASGTKRRRTSAIGPRDPASSAFSTTPMKTIPEGSGNGSKLTIRRRSSAVSRRMSLKGVELGKSTSGQTMFNAIAVLVGIGVLSEPLAFAYCGWIGGTLLLIFFGVVTNYTAKLLAGIILADPNLSGYSDMGIKAFGKTARLWVDVLFCVELFALSTAWIVIFGDSLHSVLPRLSSDVYKMIGFFVVAPTTLLPLRLLSIPSLLSLVSSFAIIIILLVDGFAKDAAPGSILHPTETSLSPDLNNANVLGGLGLLIAGFGGHAIIPSLAIDMRHPEKFNRVVNVAYIVASVVFFIAGAAGYLMFGNNVTDEITRDLTKPKYGFSVKLNQAATWLIVLNPITKFALCTRPLNLTIETIFSLNPSPPPWPGHKKPEPEVDLSSQFSTATGAFSTIPVPEDAPADYVSAERVKTAWRVVARSLITIACVLVAILLPGFGRLMSLVGSLTTFLICVILPILFYTKITPRKERGPMKDGINACLMVICTIMMISGTIWSITTEDRPEPE